MEVIFANRREAGKELAQRLLHYENNPNVKVLGLPRGGIPVAYEIAMALHVPLDVFVVRKLGTPGQPELAMGAIAPQGVRVVNEEIVNYLRISPEQIDAIAHAEEKEVERREAAYRQGRPPLNLNDRIAILVDDGLATGATMKAAVAAVKLQSPTKVVVAVPVAAASTRDEFQSLVDEIVCLETPEPLTAIGRWYADFTQTSDEEVIRFLEDAPYSPAIGK